MNIKHYMVAASLGFFAMTSMGADHLEKISVSGQFLGGISVIESAHEDQDSAPARRQFDSAANLDFTYELSDEIEGLFQLQTGAGNGANGLVGPEAALTDVSVKYSPKGKAHSWTLGSFDTPFGQHAGALSNNADTFNNRFVSNDLLYSSFAGPMGTLNTLGVLGNIDLETEQIQVSFSNGTREDANNTNGNFEYAIAAQTQRLWNKLNLGVAYMNAADLTAGGDSFNADFQGQLIDFDLKLKENGGVKGYIGSLEYGDQVAATDDKVSTWKLEAYCDHGNYEIGLGVSEWNPSDDNGDGTTNALPSIGFGQTNAGAAVATTDQKVTRYQIGITRKVSEHMIFKTELLYDNYKSTKTDVWGVSSFVNVSI